jgi:hypothetical protein
MNRRTFFSALAACAVAPRKLLAKLVARPKIERAPWKVTYIEHPPIYDQAILETPEMPFCPEKYLGRWSVYTDEVTPKGDVWKEYLDRRFGKQRLQDRK